MNATTAHTYYVNGEFVLGGEAALPVNDLGLLRGYGIFEVLRTYGKTPFGLREHLERLLRSADQIDLYMPWSLEQLEAIVHETLAHNDPSDVSVRIVVTGGPSTNFILPEEKPGLLVMVAPVSTHPARCYTEGVSLITVDFERFMPTVKSLNYVTAIMAQQRAQRQGAIEALYRTPADELTECTTCNFFVFRGDQLITPEIGVLPGITQHYVLEVAEDLFEIVRRPIAYAELTEIDEAFVTSTTKEVMPVVRVDDMSIGSGAPGVRTRHLMNLFHGRVRMYTSSA